MAPACALAHREGNLRRRSVEVPVPENRADRPALDGVHSGATVPKKGFEVNDFKPEGSLIEAADRCARECFGVKADERIAVTAGLKRPGQTWPDDTPGHPIMCLKCVEKYATIKGA